jgi:hypothetical protein
LLQVFWQVAVITNSLRVQSAENNKRHQTVLERFPTLTIFCECSLPVLLQINKKNRDHHPGRNGRT